MIEVEKWFTVKLAWSSNLKKQFYEFTCKNCKKVYEKPSDKGFDPPKNCFYCGEI